MLTHPTAQRLIALGLVGMAKALEEQRWLPDLAALAFEDRLGLMVDREAIERQNKREFVFGISGIRPKSTRNQRALHPQHP